MAVLYFIPKWFLGADVGLEILFACITLAVAVYGLRIGRLSEQKEPKLFGYGFLFIGVSYLARALLNLFFLSNLNESLNILEVRELNALSSWSIHLYIVFFILGLATLVYMTTKTKKDSLYPLIVFLALIPVGVLWWDINGLALFFYIIAVGILFYMDVHYFQEWRRSKNPRTGNMLIAFSLLTLALFDLTFATNSYIHYLLSHLFELIAYIVILSNLARVAKNEQKKK